MNFLISNRFVKDWVFHFQEGREEGAQAHGVDDAEGLRDGLTEDQIAEALANGTLDQLVVPAQQAAAPEAAPEAPQIETQAAQRAPLAQATLTGPPPVNESRLTTARIQNFAPRQVSPIQPKPVINTIGKRAI